MWRKTEKTVSEQNGNLNKEIEKPKRKSKRSPGAERYNNQNENSLEEFKGRFELAKERISMLEVYLNCL